MRIVVAMSGGVDSSVVAGLLHEAGHEVIGVTLQLYDHGAATGRKGACCAGQDIHDARRVADHLGIPHYVIDAEQRFADAVIGDFADSYAAGETPVPCVRCNQTVKFADLTALARGLGARAAGDRPLRAPDRRRRRARNCIAPPIWRATRAGSCSPPRASSSAFALFPLGGMPDKRRCARRRRGWACRWPPSRTARTSASSRPATTPISSRGCVPTPASRARSSIADGARARPARRHRALHGRAGKRLGDRRRCVGGERQVVVALDPARRRVVVGPRDAGTRRCGCAR